MDFNCKENKGFRLLSIYERLMKGEEINKQKLAYEFDVTPKSIQRDIEDLRSYICETHYTDVDATVAYDRSNNSYKLVKIEREWLTPDEVLAISKILLESRAFNKAETDRILDKLLSQVLPETRTKIKVFVQSEMYSYSPLHHNKDLIKTIWKLTDYINNVNQIIFTYKKQDSSVSQRVVNPVAIIFSEHYFYLVAIDDNDTLDCPKNFRIDRIENISETGNKFEIPYSKRFKEGEYKNRIQFMYPGKLFKTKFRFNGDSLEAVLDRLPTARVISEDENGAILEAEIYGEGVKRWMLSQKSGIEVLEPEWFRNEIRDEINKMAKLYKLQLTNHI